MLSRNSRKRSRSIQKLAILGNLNPALFLFLVAEVFRRFLNDHKILSLLKCYIGI